MRFVTPYADPTYFIWLFAILIPIIVWRLLKGRRLVIYEIAATFFFLFVSFGGPNLKQGLALFAYVLWQLLLATSYAYYRKKLNAGRVFYTVVGLSILPLVLTKVLPFFAIQSLFGFLGISYLTFKAVQVIMEIRDGVIKKFSPLVFIDFILFFPTISSGPIDRYRRFVKDRKQVIARRDYLTMLNQGIFKIFLGFLYKFILGYYLGSRLLPVIANMALARGGLSWSLVGYMYVYSLYLFFDFAGYSLFAVGVSYFLGVKTPDNFHLPFLSPSIKEFWNRWHMSLSFWFRDYVYMRLMFLLMKKRWFKSNVVNSCIGYYALFLLMGAWHGLTWYYLAYGVYHATWIVLTDTWGRFAKRRKITWTHTPLGKAVCIFGTFNGVTISFLIFSGFLNTLFFT